MATAASAWQTRSRKSSPDTRRTAQPTRAPHLAIVPLAFAGFPHADGRLFGFALIPGAQTALREVPGLRAAFEKIAPFDHGIERRVLELKFAPPRKPLQLSPAGVVSKRSLAPEPYLRPARVWASVTPIVLDRHLKRYDEAKIRELIAASCSNVGLPQPDPARIQVGKHSGIEGAPPAWPPAGAPPWTAWRVPQPLASRSLTHAVIDFGREVAGPVLLGAGRFTGSGSAAASARTAEVAALTPADFTKFFTGIHGHPPFPCNGGSSSSSHARTDGRDVLDLPTGAGKTAALDAAVFHLALQQSVTPRRAALRIALVVDRRLVVDDAHRRAETIACALADPSRVKTGRAVVGEVARRLQRLAGDGEPPLVAVRRAAGAPLEHDWARTPTQPTILCSTVDQVGSRLLFRGYGVSSRMSPVHAGLLGEDTLILLDGGAPVRTVPQHAADGAHARQRERDGGRPHGHAGPRLRAALRARAGGSPAPGPQAAHRRSQAGQVDEAATQRRSCRRLRAGGPRSGGAAAPRRGWRRRRSACGQPGRPGPRHLRAAARQRGGKYGCAADRALA